MTCVDDLGLGSWFFFLLVGEVGRRGGEVNERNYGPSRQIFPFPCSIFKYDYDQK